MPNTRIIVLIIAAVCIAYDFVCVAFGWQTISTSMRNIDNDSGHLVCWMWLALFLHWFWPYLTNRPL